ncbi:HlyC/CorC family transporter [Rhodocista pekingensis]|uniref:HlyC/CorC family transporter n=1 Tax=Rhodocista pekingensis TaxID=201185 RepID=A0ABW2KTP3_9PROT
MDLTLWLTVAGIFVLLVLSAFFSGSETALTAASRARVHQLAQEGDRRARMVQDLREHKDRLIGAILLGNNLVNILASSLATSVLIVLVGEAGVAVATLAMTLLILIFSEVLPKTYALHYADRAALAVAPTLRIVVRLLAPVTLAVTTIVRLVLRAFGTDVQNVTVGDHADELRGYIELHRGPEEEVRHERAMLRSILELADVEVLEIMTHRRNLVMVDASQPAERIAEEVLECPFTRVPLWEENPDNIVGVLHVKALLRELRNRGGSAGGIDVKAIAATPWFIPDTTTLFDQLQAFRQRREHFALVVDEYGSLMGIVTLEDILEEIVGDITDELDVAVAGVRPQPNGTYIVDGWVTIRDLNREFEWGLPDEQASTIAGLVLYEARRIPEVGQAFSFHGFKFEILRRHRHQITALRITPPEHLRPHLPPVAPPRTVPPPAPPAERPDGTGVAGRT